MSKLANKGATMEEPSDETDFRVRAAKEKRERMRKRLLEATLAACSLETIRNPAMLEDVLKAADVSRGTFYKYFASLDEAIGELGHQLMREMIDTVALVLRGLTDPRERVVAGPLMYLARAAQNPQWGVFVSRIEHLDAGGRERFIEQAISHDLTEADREGVIAIPSLEAAIDLLVGASRQAVLRIIAGGRRDLGHILALITMSMMALGMTRRDAERSVSRTWKHIALRHAETMPWVAELGRQA